MGNVSDARKAAVRDPPFEEARTMHDYTVTQLNDHRLAQFDAEADQSRLQRVAAARRPRDRPAAEVSVTAVARIRRILDHVALAAAKARLRGA
jgi:hypothetical protein